MRLMYIHVIVPRIIPRKTCNNTCVDQYQQPTPSLITSSHANIKTISSYQMCKHSSKQIHNSQQVNKGKDRKAREVQKVSRWVKLTLPGPKRGKTCSELFQQLQGWVSPPEGQQLEGRIVVQPHCSPSLMTPGWYLSLTDGMVLWTKKKIGVQKGHA